MTRKAAGHQQTGKLVGHPSATLALAGILAAAVRLYFMRDWLNYDESMHYLVTMSPLGEGSARRFRLRAHPTLSYHAMKPPRVASGGSASAAWVPSCAMPSHQLDYEGIPVLESPNAAKLLVDALTLARQYGRAWILYSNLKSDADLSNTYKTLQQGLAADPSVRVLFAQKNDLFVISSIIIAIEKIPAPDRRSPAP